MSFTVIPITTLLILFGYCLYCYSFFFPIVFVLMHSLEVLDVYVVINFEKQMIRSSTNGSVAPGGTPLWQEAYTLYAHFLHP